MSLHGRDRKDASQTNTSEKPFAGAEEPRQNKSLVSGADSNYFIGPDEFRSGVPT